MIKAGPEGVETQQPPAYKAQCARDAQAGGYGDQDYWEWLDQSAQEHHDYFMAKGDPVTAVFMLTRDIGEALLGNDGD